MFFSLNISVFVYIIIILIFSVSTDLSCIKIVVLDERPDKHCIKHEFIPDVSPDHTIILHRKQDHYNALIPFKLPVSSVSPSSALSDTRMPKSVQSLPCCIIGRHPVLRAFLIMLVLSTEMMI